MGYEVYSNMLSSLIVLSSWFDALCNTFILFAVDSEVLLWYNIILLCYFA